MMGKDEDNLCRQALIEGRDTCKLYLRRKPKKGEIRSAVWRENDKDITKLLEGKSKVENVKRKKLPKKDEPAKHKNMVWIQMQNN